MYVFTCVFICVILLVRFICFVFTDARVGLLIITQSCCCHQAPIIPPRTSLNVPTAVCRNITDSFLNLIRKRAEI